MKLPYRAGDFFALPLGDGSFTRAQIVAVEHRVVLVDVAGRILRASDDALMHHRWRRIAHAKPPVSAIAENAYWMHSARAEREFATSLGVAVPKRSATRVLEVRDDAIPDAAAAGTTLSWSAPLKRLDAIAGFVAADPTIRIRVQDDAARQVADMQSWRIAALSIAGPCTALPVMSNVRKLALLDVAPLQSFPFVTHLRVVHRGAFDARELLAMPNLEHLELSGVALVHQARFINCPSLRTLRVSRTTGLEKARHVALPQLQTLCLDHTGELAELRVLSEMQALEQLELLGFWQHDLSDVHWLLEMRTLKRAEIDIGGRRKNIELYRRADWAYPWPF